MDYVPLSKLNFRNFAKNVILGFIAVNTFMFCVFSLEEISQSPLFQ